MNIDQRREEILELINKEGSQRTSDLAKRYGVSSETIRKDFLYLKEKNMLLKSYGRAQAITEFSEFPVSYRSTQNLESKIEIAKKAIEFVKKGSVIFIDSGSTLAQFASLLGARQDIAIITSSFSAAQAMLEFDNNIYFIGGEVSSISQSTYGVWASDALHSINIDTAFLGTSGFRSHSGPCTKTFPDSQLKKEVMSVSDTVIVLADNSKFTDNALNQYAKWSDIDYLITDSKTTPEEMQNVSKLVEIIKTEE